MSSRLGVAYTQVANSFRHTISWIIEALGTTKKTNDIATTHFDINGQTLEALKQIVVQGQKLPSDFVEGTKMIAEEHVVAILYDQLIDQEKRSDCAIVISTAGDKTLPYNFNVDAFKGNVKLRYLLVPMSVNSNTHNTILIIDRLREKYAYFDSFGNKVPSYAIKECKDKNVIAPNYTAADTSEQRTSQTDNWSCGFHVPENAIAFVKEEEIINKRPLGNDLRNKYRQSFEHFANTHGKTDRVIESGILSRRQKMVLRDALENVLSNNTHPSLRQLWRELKNEILPDNINEERPLKDFTDHYLKKYPQDTDGKQVLIAAATPGNSISLNLPKSVDETAEQSADSEKAITQFIKKLFL